MSGLPPPPPGFAMRPPNLSGLPPPPAGMVRTAGLPPPPPGLRSGPPSSAQQPPGGMPYYSPSGLPPAPTDFGMRNPQLGGHVQQTHGGQPQPGQFSGYPPTQQGGYSRPPAQDYPRQQDGYSRPQAQDYPRQQDGYSRPPAHDYARQQDGYSRPPAHDYPRQPHHEGNAYPPSSFPNNSTTHGDGYAHRTNFDERGSRTYPTQQSSLGSGHGYPQPRGDGSLGGSGGGGGGFAPHRSYETREATNTVWVGNLDPQHGDDLLRHLFSPFGRIMRIAHQRDKNFCFVHFRTREEAQSAVQSLTAQGSLGRAKLSYGKQFEYTAEELDPNYGGPGSMPPRGDRGEGGGGYYRGNGEQTGGSGAGYHRGERPPLSQHMGGGGADPSRDGFRDRPKRSRDDDNAVPPSNILWVGSIPPTLTTEELRQNFESFGTITNVSRLSERNMAFIHFSSTDECTHALNMMRGQPIGGAMLTLNYGRAQRTSDAPSSSDPSAPPPNEIPTNVVYLGQVASSATHDEVDRCFDQFEGFINAKFISASGIAFGHFDTVENAKACRLAMQGQLLGGAPFKVSFGKHNHTMTMADRKVPPPLPSAADAALVDAFQGSTGGGGALVVRGSAGGEGGAGSLVIPAMGSSGMPTVTLPGLPKFYTKDRPQPAITVEVRLSALKAATYNNCGEPEKNLRPNIVQNLCDRVDQCVDAESENLLDVELAYFAPQNAAHMFAIAAKRMKEFYSSDRHKKLLVLYACSRVLFGTRIRDVAFSKPSIWSFLVLLAVASEEQDEPGINQIKLIVDKLKTAQDFYLANRLDEAFITQFNDQLDQVISRAVADQELAKFSKRKK